MTWIYVWLGVVAVALIIEFVTMELVSVWIALGGVVAMLLAAVGTISVEIQLTVFVVVSLACIIGLRKVTLKFLNRYKGKTNLDAVIGTQHKLIKPITEDELGSLKVNGVEWNAKTANCETVASGEVVEILEVEGNKFIVKKIGNSTSKNEETALKAEDNKEPAEEKTEEKVIEKQTKTSKAKTSSGTKSAKNTAKKFAK